MEATSIIGISTPFIGDGLAYHTPWDTVDALDPEAVRAVLEILMNFTVRMDAEASGRVDGSASDPHAIDQARSR